MNRIVVAALYKFVSLPDYQDLQLSLKKVCAQNQIKGILLLAKEGLNGTVAGARADIDTLLAFLRKDARFADLEVKESQTSDYPFHRMKVRLKKEIVTMGVPEVDPTKVVGTYVQPQDWNALISDPDTLVLDTRNGYEVDIGTFESAVDPKTDSFREFPKFVRTQLNPKKHKKVAMFCTGGIRCEKASAFMLGEGFPEVYHLKGGILKYLETIPEKDSLWRGECFVFDQRVAVKEGVEEGQYDLCYGCRYPISQADKDSKLYEKGVQCPHCHDQMTKKQKARAQARHRQMVLAHQRGHTHLGSVLESGKEE